MNLFDVPPIIAAGTSIAAWLTLNYLHRIRPDPEWAGIRLGVYVTSIGLTAASLGPAGWPIIAGLLLLPRILNRPAPEGHPPVEKHRQYNSTLTVTLDDIRNQQAVVVIRPDRASYRWWISDPDNPMAALELASVLNSIAADIIAKEQSMQDARAARLPEGPA